MFILYNLAYLLVFHFTLSDSPPVRLQPSSAVSDSVWMPQKVESNASGIIFKSADGGETWQDISQGLPGIENQDGIQPDGFFADENGLYLPAGNGIYHSEPNSVAPFWKKEFYCDKQMQTVSGRNKISAYNHNERILPVTQVANAWWPASANSMQADASDVYQTSEGIAFIASNSGFYRSRDYGNTWTKLHEGAWRMKMAESNGVLLATSQHGIIKSTDDGETWNYVISEGGVGIAVEAIDGGFATISFNTTTQTRRIHISSDNGKTWKAIEAGLKPSMNISSIKQLGGYLFCGHPDGIFSSPDQGKTWKLLFPSVGEKVFKLTVKDNIIYAISANEGC